MPYKITPEENEREIARLRATLEAKGDGKCYYPYSRCRGFNRRRLLKTTIGKHCREYGHIEWGYEYRPMVSY